MGEVVTLQQALQRDNVRQNNPGGERSGYAFAHHNFYHKEEFISLVLELCPNLTRANIEKIWNAVVLIKGKGKKLGTQEIINWSGTGWLIQNPPRSVNKNGETKLQEPTINSLVITNRHVYNDLDAYEITLNAVFEDELFGRPKSFELSRNPRFFSNIIQGTPNLEQLDFAVFEFNVPTSQDRLGELQNLCSSPLRWEESPARMLSCDIAMIIGHPRGGYKKGSVASNVIIHTFSVSYDETHTRPGNSGSPVMLFKKDGPVMTNWIGALHYASGSGILFSQGIAEIIRDQFMIG